MTDTLQQAIEFMARRSVALQLAPPTYQEKCALSSSDVLSTIGNNPALSHALLGGGLGAVAGGVSNVLGNRDKDKNERKSLLGSLLGGGLAGAAIGGGAGLARQAWNSRSNGHANIPEGSFTDPQTGARMHIDPKQLAQHPELAEEVRRLNRPPHPVDAAMKPIAGNIYNLATKAVPPANWLLRSLGWTYGDGDTFLDKHFPLSSNVLPAVGAFDAAAHMPGLNLGERIGVGRVRPEHSNNPDDLVKGVATKGEELGVPDKLRKAILSDTPHNPRNTSGQRNMDTPYVPGAKPGDARSVGATLVDKLNSRPSTGRGGGLLDRLLNRYGGQKDPVLEMTHQPIKTIEQEYRDPKDPDYRVKDTVEQPLPAKTEAMTRGQAERLNREGYLANEAQLDNKTPRGLRRIFGHQYQSPPLAARVGGRLAVYGGLPLLEYLGRTALDQRRDDQRLQELMRQVAQPAR